MEVHEDRGRGRERDRERVVLVKQRLLKVFL